MFDLVCADNYTDMPFSVVYYLVQSFFYATNSVTDGSYETRT